MQIRILELADRLLNLLELWVTRKYPVQERDGELWRKGDPLPEPKTEAEYREYPSQGPGRFERAIEQARRNANT